jgi:diguanylate cyclase (GGDEF)-like protein
MSKNPLHSSFEGETASLTEVFSRHRELLGLLVAFGDIALAVGAVIGFWDHMDHRWLLTWGALIIITSAMWEIAARKYPESTSVNGKLRNQMAWISTIIWGSLPWMMMGSLSNGAVAWMLVFVIVFAIATDLLYVTSGDAPAIDYMVLAYTFSFVAALATEFQFLPLAAIVLAGAIIVAIASAWTTVAVELIEKRTESETLSKIDALTGLSTRGGAIEAARQLISDGAENIHCAFIDIDDFKHLNDNHGYDVGDSALQSVGRFIRQELPADWTVSRFGGDEFVAVGSTLFDFDDLVETVIHFGDHENLTISQSLSIGFTSVPADLNTVESELFREASAALRFAKRLGKRQVMVMTDELRALEDSKIALGGRVGAALEAGEIVPWAQKIINFDTGEVVGIELLARWEQPDGALIMPDTFIPVIEDQGRGPELGLVMITNAIEALAHPQLRDQSAFVTVNISARHLYHRHLPTEVFGLLAHHNVTPRQIVLEITGSQDLPSSPIWRETANHLRALGIGLAMGDFGSGYSSMEQLLEFPFTHVKIDRVITHAHERPGAADLASAIAAMTSGSGMVTIVECIDTDEQLTAMRQAGYQLGQGFLFHRPEPLADVMASVTSSAETRTEGPN